MPNYIRESFNTDLDFGTGEWSVGAWVNVPAVLPVANFPVGSEMFTDFTTEGLWTDNGNGSWSISNSAGNTDLRVDFAGTAGKIYRVSFTFSGVSSTQPQVFALYTSPGGYGNGTYTFPQVSNVGFFIVRAPIGTSATISSISIREMGSTLIADRAHSSGPRIQLGLNPAGYLTATAFDGTTTRTVTTTAAYNTATWLKAEADYTTDGSLAITVNGVEVAVTRGNPLLTLNNSNAVLTIGNSFALDAPFPGSIALLKASATVPTAEQLVWIYEQEKQMFRDGAQVTLPDAGSIVDLTYDDLTDTWIAVSATNESEFSGLVRTNVTAVPAGSYSKVTATSGIQLQARTTTNPGVDITIPAANLREELLKDAEAANKLNAQLAIFDYVGGFTANTTSGATSITSAAGITYPVSYIGARVTGTGIPTDTFILGISGTTLYLSKAATATGTAVQLSFTDFILPVGYEAKVVLSAGLVKTEGTTKDYIRLFDGFKETIRFGTAPGYNTAVQIQATRSIQ
jgi:hypothetical protein